LTVRTEDQDLAIKLRMMRLLWHTGHFVRHNVSIERMYETDRRAQSYTDLDVLAIRIDPELTSSTYVADCKSGATAKTTERLFWLVGVMKYCGARKGFFVRTQMLTTKYADLASQLDIVPLSLAQLNELERAYNIAESPFLGPYNRTLIEKATDGLGLLHETLPRVHNYLLIKYWRDSVYQRIAMLMEALSLVRASTKFGDELKLFSAAYTLPMLAIATIQFAQPLLTIPPRDREELIRDRLLGGREEALQRKQLMESFYEFMAGEIKARYHQRYPISKNDFLSHFYPPHTKYLTDLVERICLAPAPFAVVPQVLDLVAFEGVLGGQLIDENKLAPISRGIPIPGVLKAAKDVVTFVERSGVIDQQVAARIREHLSNLVPPETGKPVPIDKGGASVRIDGSQMVLPEGKPDSTL